MTSKMQIYVFFFTSTFVTKQNSSNSFNSVKLICCFFSLLMLIYYYRLQNSPYFCVFKLRALKQKVWNESRGKLWSCCSGERMFPVFYQQDFTKALFIRCLFKFVHANCSSSSEQRPIVIVISPG